MNKTHNAEQYIAKMGETMRLAFRYGVTPQIGIIPNYPLNRRQDVDSIFEYLDHLRRMRRNGPNDQDSTPRRLAIIFSPVCPTTRISRCFRRWVCVGLRLCGQLSRIEGCTTPKRRDAASKEYSHQDFLTDRFKFYGKAHKTPLAIKNTTIQPWFHECIGEPHRSAGQ